MDRLEILSNLELIARNGFEIFDRGLADESTKFAI